MKTPGNVIPALLRELGRGVARGHGGAWTSLAQPPGLYRQREQTAAERLDSLGDRAGDTAGHSRAW